MFSGFGDVVEDALLVEFNFVELFNTFGGVFDLKVDFVFGGGGFGLATGVVYFLADVEFEAFVLFDLLSEQEQLLLF